MQSVELPAEPDGDDQAAPDAHAWHGCSGGDTWLVMVYQDADDKILEKDIYIDLNEIERVGSSANVQIVAQIDRYRGGYEGDGDWVTARRYYATQDDDLLRVAFRSSGRPGGSEYV